MKFTKLLAKNWTCHEELDVSFRAGICAILGQNGSGKSSVLDALRFGLTGESIAEGKISDNLKFGAKKGSVEIHFEHGGKDYTIKRNVHAGGQTLILPDGKTNMTRSADINQFIEDLLGTKIDSLLNNIFVGQNDIDSILFKTAGDRLKEFQDTFGLTRLADAHRLLTQEMSLYKITNGLQEQFDVIAADRKLAADSLAEAEAALKDCDKQLKALDVYVERIRTYEQASRTLSAIGSAQAALDEAQKKFDEAAAITAQEVAKLERATRLADSIDSMEAAISEQWNKCLAAQSTSEKRKKLINDLTKAEAELAKVPVPDTAEGDALFELSRNLDREQEADTAAIKTKSYLVGNEAYDLAKSKIRTIENAKATIVSRDVSDREHELKQIVAQLKKAKTQFAGGICPTCKQSVVGHDPKQLDDELAAAEKELSSVVVESTRVWRETNEALDAKLVAVNSILTQIESELVTKLTEAVTIRHGQLQKLLGKKQQYNLAVTVYSQLNGSVAQIKANLGQLQDLAVSDEEFAKAKADYENFNKVYDELNKAETSYRIAKAAEDQRKITLDKAIEARANLSVVACASQVEIDEAQAKMADVEKYTQLRKDLATAIGTKTASVSMYDNQLKLLKEQISQEAKTKEWVQRCSAVRDAFHVNALPKMLMQEYATRLNRRMAHYLQVWEAPFSVYLDENMAFIAKFPSGVTVSAGRLSGGQKIVASLSFRMAMSDTFAKNVGLIVLDEPTNHLDKNNIVHLQQLLLKLKSLAGGSGRQIILVTHEETLTGFLDHIVRL
jgi:exonuclease SbcC